MPREAVGRAGRVSGPYFKRLLQRVAVHTQFSPFVWFYRAIYALAVRLCVRRLRRIRGVHSIYLRRGLAGDRPVYGLSDIDLLVIVGSANREDTAARVRHQYRLLRRMVPMLADLGELEVYDPGQFSLLHDYSPFYRLRFERGRREWKRLFGEDVFESSPPVAGEERLLAAEELGPAWRLLAEELLPSGGRPSFMRAYLAYKAVAEAARATLIARGEEVQISRDTAVARASQVCPEVAEALRSVQRFRQKLSSPRSIPVDLLLNSFLHLARAALAAKPREGRFRRDLLIQSPIPDEVEILRRRGAVRVISRTCAELHGIERAVLVPRLSLDPIPVLGLDPARLMSATIDALDLVLVGRALPPAAELQRLNLALEAVHPTVTPYFSDGELAVCLRPSWGWTVRDRQRAPELFACLSAAAPLDGVLKIAGAVEVKRAFDHSDSLELRARTLLELYGDPKVFRLPIRDVLVLFWETGRAACIAAQSDGGAVNVPVSSAQVVDALAALTPSAEPVLRQIYREYITEIREGSSDAGRYARWIGSYASTLKQLLFGPEGPVARLPSPAKTEMTMSVVIVTRNRAPLLRRALDSLVRQQRRPEQVIVVDNASSDETWSVAESFSGRLDLTLVREERVGVPHARNTGLALCRGDVVAFLDDDCEADPEWLLELEIPFLKDPNIGAVGGSMLPNRQQRGLMAGFFSARMGNACEGEEAGAK